MQCKVGKYIVYVKEFEEQCLPLVETINENTLLVLDEIGKMELFSKRFEQFIEKLLTQKNNLKILATVPMKSVTPVIDDLKQYKYATLFHITKSNRDSVLPKLKTAVENLFIQ
jgi:nucleoside-triphosphatase